MFSNQTIFAVPDHGQVVGNVVDDEAVIINFISGFYYALSGAGREIWLLVEAGATIEEMLLHLGPIYDAVPEALEADIRALLQLCLDGGLAVTRGERAPLGAFQAIDARRRPYTTPTLVKFDDLAESFAIDPPLPFAVR